MDIRWWWWVLFFATGGPTIQGHRVRIWLQWETNKIHLIRYDCSGEWRREKKYGTPGPGSFTWRVLAEWICYFFISLSKQRRKEAEQRVIWIPRLKGQKEGFCDSVTMATRKKDSSQKNQMIDWGQRFLPDPPPSIPEGNSLQFSDAFKAVGVSVFAYYAENEDIDCHRWMKRTQFGSRFIVEELPQPQCRRTKWT